MTLRYRLCTLWLLMQVICPAWADKDVVQSHEWLSQNYTQREVEIDMRDGIRLHTAIFEPTDEGQHPILMLRTCYGVPYKQTEKVTAVDYLAQQSLAEYTRNHYILVFQDVRGKNASEGTFVDQRPYIPKKKNKKQVDEASDTYDTAEWLIRNTKNNGNMGVWGISYPGFYATMAALSGHPAIKAVSPQAPSIDWFVGDDAHHGGALCLMDMFNFSWWFQYANTLDVRTGKQSASQMLRPDKDIQGDVYQAFLQQGALHNISDLMGDSVSMWNDNVKHPDLDDFWRARTVTNHLIHIRPAVLVVGGMFDAEDCYGPLATYRAIHRQSPATELYLVEGPWAHGAWAGGAGTAFGQLYLGNQTTSEYYLKEIEYPFFAYYLEGKGEKPSYGAKVFHTGENRWHDYQHGWAMVQRGTAFFLQPGGILNCVEPTGTGKTAYISDPQHPVPYFQLAQTRRDNTYMTGDQRFASQRPDVATFCTHELTDTLRLGGPIKADLYVSLSTTDADFIVKVIDVYPDNFNYADNIRKEMPKNPNTMAGYQMLIRQEILRGRYREGFDKPRAFKPDEITHVPIQMNDVAHTLLPGHKLMIQVQSTCFPLFDRNPQQFVNIYQCADEDYIPSDITLYHQPGAASCVWLPIK